MNDRIRSSMAYKRKRSYKRKRPTFKRVMRKVKRANLNRIIRKEIARNVENKTIQSYNLGKNLYSTDNVLFPDNVIPVGPNATTLAILQGTGQGSRVGNTITTRKLRFKGVLTPMPYNATSNPNPRPVMVKMVVVYDRTDPNGVPVPGNQWFQDGNTTAGFTNDLVDMWRPINTDRYRVLLTRTFKLGYAAYTGAAGSVANQTANQAWTNNDFKLNCTFSVDLTKFYPKRVKFNDNNAEPTTRGLNVLWYMAFADGTAIPDTWVVAQVQFMQDYVYEDA